MSVPTTDVHAGGPRHVPPAYRLTFRGLVRAEWIKLWSIRSTVVTMVVAAVCIVGSSVLLTGGSTLMARGGDDGMQGADGLAVAMSLSGVQLAVLVIAAVGVVFITGEYSTGAIRTSFAAAPARVPVLLAKAVALGVAVALVQGVAVLVAYVTGQAILSTIDAGVGLGEPDVLRVLAGNILVLTGVAVAGLGLGAVMRHTAAAVCGVIALLFVAPLLLLPVPDFPGKAVLESYGFANTTSALTSMLGGGTGPSVGASAVAFCLWVGVLLTLGALVLRARDV